MSKYQIRRELAAYEATSHDLETSWERQAREEVEAAEAWEAESGYRSKLGDKADGY